jgi:hypothetical protein
MWPRVIWDIYQTKQRHIAENSGLRDDQTYSAAANTQTGGAGH